MYEMKNEFMRKYLLKKAIDKWREDLTNDKLRRKFFGVLLKTTFGRM